MSINWKLFLIMLTLVGMISFGDSCKKRKNCNITNYNFEMGIRGYPDQDSILIGDTIYLEVDESVLLSDLSTGQIINYDNAQNLGTAIGIGELISPGVVTQFVNVDFHFYLIKGITVPRPDTNQFREYLFAENLQRYQFKVAIIPQRRGIFKMFISNAANVFRRNDECSKASFSINFKNTNQHLYFNEVSFPGIILPPGGGVYLFKVK